MSPMTATQTAQIERRRVPRQDIGSHLIDLHPGNDDKVIHCLLWDISELGARLVLPHDVDLNPVVYVIVGNVCKAASLIWRDGTDIGLEFIEDE